MDPKSAIKGGSFCPLPWTGFMMEPKGTVKNCVLSVKNSIGNINDESIQDILAGKNNQERKDYMREHKKHRNCSECHKLEHNKTGMNIRSDRYYYLKSLASVPYSTYDSDETILKTVDMRWRNTCNLACVYCGPDLSSSWEKELGIPVTVDEQKLKNTKNYVLEHAHELKNVYLAGGEPLLMKENSELLDRLDPECTVRINTNLTNIQSPVYKKASKFKNVHWTLSVEAMGKEFEYIRYGANWDKWLDNLNTLRELDHKICFNMLWFVLNPYSVFDTVDFFMDIGFVENSFIIGPVTGPKYFDIRNLKDTTIQDLSDILKTRIHQTNTKYLLNDSYNNMLAHTLLPFEKQTQYTIEKLNEMDARRKIDHKKIFDIYQYI